MNRRHFLRTTAGIATTTTVGLAGCLGSASATGTLATRLSDRPGDIDDFGSCVVTVTGVRVEPVDGESETHKVSPTDLDLTELTGERSALVSELELDVGTYESLQLQVSETTGTLKDGGTPAVSVPGSAPLQFKHQFEIRENQRTAFTADVVPVRAGGSGMYLLKPVAEAVQVSYERTERPRRRLPAPRRLLPGRPLPRRLLPGRPLPRRLLPGRPLPRRPLTRPAAPRSWRVSSSQAARHTLRPSLTLHRLSPRTQPLADVPPTLPTYAAPR